MKKQLTKIPQVFETTDYDQFVVLEGNRPINKGLILAIEQSIHDDGNYLQYNPIIVNEHNEVIDGQHRLAVAKKMGVSVYGIVAPGMKLRQTQTLNSKKRAWISADYLHALITQGNRDAMLVRELMNEYKFSVAIVVRCLGLTAEGSIMQKFRDGKFVVKDREKGEDLLGVLSTIRDHSPDYAFAHSACLKAVISMMEKVTDPKVFQRKLEQYNQVITRRASPKDYLSQFENIIKAGGDNKEVKLT